jgi:RNA polymerase sigma factor (sigma-70 family)
VITLQDENLLIDRILTGERQCYAPLVDHYKTYAFTIAYKIVNSRPDAEEIAQDAFIKAFHYLKSFNRQAKFSTWLYRIVFNTAISYKRKNHRQFQSVQDNLVAHAPVVQDLEKEDKQVFIARAMEKLNAADRQAIQLFYIQEFSLEEVAETMGQIPATIKVRVHRARQRLADELKKILKQEALTL